MKEKIPSANPPAFVPLLCSIAAVLLHACAGLSGALDDGLYAGMTTVEVAERHHSPDVIRPPALDVRGRTVDGWEYGRLRLFFVNSQLLKWEVTDERWEEPLEIITRTDLSRIAYAPPSQAQQEFLRIGLGAGGGAAASVCDQCNESAWTGQLSGTMLIMFRIDPQWSIGLQPTFSGKGGDIWEIHDIDWRSSNTYWGHFMLVGHYYPSDNFFLKLGGGVSFYNSYDQHVSTRPDYPTQVHGEGPGIMAGAGYDIRISPSFVVTPTVSYFHGFLSGINLNSYKTLYERKSLNEFDLSVLVSFTAGR